MTAPRWLLPVTASALALCAVVSEVNRASNPSPPVVIESAPVRESPAESLVASHHPDILVVPGLLVSKLPTRPRLDSAAFPVLKHEEAAPKVLVQFPKKATRKYIAARKPHARNFAANKPSQARRQMKLLAATPRFDRIERTERISSVTYSRITETRTATPRPSFKQKLGKVWAGLKAKFRRKSEAG